MYHSKTWVPPIDVKVIAYHATLAARGKTMNIAVTDKLYGTTSQFLATKQ